MSTPNPFDFPVVVTAAGMQPQDPEDLRRQIQAAAIANSPGITTDLPGILLDDILSTDTPAVALCDQARVEAVNSLDPGKANEALLIGLGSLYGVPYGLATNTGVLVVFSGTVGYVVPNGFLVSDGPHIYQVQGGGAIGAGGVSLPINASAVQPGAFGVAANTVTEIKTSYPSSVTLTVNNPGAGTPGSPNPETWSSYRARVMQGGQAVVVGGPKLIKTLVDAVPGVLKGFVSIQVASGNLRVIVPVGSADLYQLAYAIFQAIDPTRLTGHAAAGTTITVSLIDPPNTYNIVFVSAAVQTVTLAITWNTNASNFTGGGAFAGLVQPPLITYINSIRVGAPINELEMNQIFQKAVAGVLNPDFLTRLVFSVSINGTPTAPGTGTFIVSGDPESYFFTALDGSGITVTQG